MPLLALGVLVAFWTDHIPRKAWALVAGLQAMLVVGGVVAMRTGGIEEDKVESVVGEQAIEQHEEAAEAFVWVAGAVLALTALGLVVPRRVVRVTAAAAAIGMTAVAGLGVRAGHAGGTLVYGRNAASAYASGPASGQRPASSREEAGESSDRDRDRRTDP